MAKPSSLLDTRVIYCGDNLEQLKKLPDACIDLIYIDPFSSDAMREIGQFLQREHISIVALTVREILDETIAHRLA
jgi:hypothetical protein